VIAASIGVPLSAQSIQEGHFAFAGPLDHILAPGAHAAQVTRGLPFTITLKDGGASVSSGRFDLKVPGAAAPLALALDGLKLQAGRLTAKASLRNGTGTASEGLRLDVVSAVESYTAKGDKGEPVVKTRPQPVHLASPLFFGDLSNGEASDVLAFEAFPIAFAPETQQVVVSGVVSGLRHAGAFDVAGVGGPSAASFDAKGRLVIGDVTGQKGVRCDAQGKGAETAFTVPDQVKAMAVNSKTGAMAVSIANDGQVWLFSESGKVDSKLGPANGIDGYTDCLRYDRDGSFYAAIGWKIVVVKGGKLAATHDIDELGSFDAAADGTVFAVTTPGLLLRLPAGLGTSATLASPGWRPGQLTNPTACRVDAAGNVYVGERTNNIEFARISVFDRNGAVVRLFGRGSKKPDPAAPEVYLPGQVYRPVDIAFGADGRVYVVGERMNNAIVEVFQPF
jgi:hypothetical protein